MTAEKRIRKTSGLLGRRSPEDIAAAARRLPSFDFDAGARLAGRPALVQVDDLVASPYQTRRLDEVKLEELAANIAANGLATPITVRRLDERRLEIVAGHHRAEAFRRLERPDIPVVVVELSDAEAERLVFYDNLLAPALTDYEKHLGFAQRKAATGFTGEQLAAEAGISPSLVSMLMAFGDLPLSVHQVLREHPGVIGAAVAPAFAQLAAKQEDLVVQALRRIAAGELTQAAALSWVRAGGVEKPAATQAAKTQIRSGRRSYAEVSRRAGRIAISFADEAEAAEIQGAIETLLRQRAESLK